MKAHLEKRGRLLGVFYDKVCRKSWAERSICGDDSFELARAATLRDEALLYRAQALYDEGKVAQAAQQTHGKGGAEGSHWQAHDGRGSKSKADVTCYKYALQPFPLGDSIKFFVTVQVRPDGPLCIQLPQLRPQSPIRPQSQEEA